MMATVFWDMESISLVAFMLRGETINTDQYYERLKNFQRIILNRCTRLTAEFSYWKIILARILCQLASVDREILFRMSTFYFVIRIWHILNNTILQNWRSVFGNGLFADFFNEDIVELNVRNGKMPSAERRIHRKIAEIKTKIVFTSKPERFLLWKCHSIFIGKLCILK